ncbi:MAG: hypothetical protein ACODAU_11395 [Myxococcota bacterium]
MPERPIRRHYVDPLDAVWLCAARRIGLRVVRSPEVYAASDGRGTLAIGTPDTLDPDDSLAQMVFHELCHSLVQGRASFELPDFGLDNASGRDVAREQACLRVQAKLADEHGLRALLAPTTEFRAFYDALGSDPLDPAGDPSAALAREARARAEKPPWGPHLRVALRATAAIARAAADAGAGELHDGAGRPSLYGALNRPRDKA